MDEEENKPYIEVSPAKLSLGRGYLLSVQLRRSVRGGRILLDGIAATVLLRIEANIGIIVFVCVAGIRKISCVSTSI